MSVVFGLIFCAVIMANSCSYSSCVSHCFFREKEKRWRRLFMAGVTPAVANVSFVGCLAVFKFVISLSVGVYFGIGDHCYVPQETAIPSIL